jgi:hypothetical protein
MYNSKSKQKNRKRKIAGSTRFILAKRKKQTGKNTKTSKEGISQQAKKACFSVKSIEERAALSRTVGKSFFAKAKK